MIRIGEILVRKNIITSSQLEEALAESKSVGTFVGIILMRKGVVTERQFLEALSEQLDLEFLPSIKTEDISKSVIKIVPAKLVRHYNFIPLRLEGESLTIAVSDPLAVWATEDLKLQLGFDVERVVTTEEEVSRAIREHYGLGAETIEGILEEKKDDQPKQQEQKDQVADLGPTDQTAETASVIRLVNQILSEAIECRATDIHIETYRDKVRVRYRTDGILYDVNVPEEIIYLHQSIVSRIKIIAFLNVVEKRLPQDGRAIVKMGNRQIDLRISIIPSLYGENVVIRILPVHLLVHLDDLGFTKRDFEAMNKIISKPHGIVFLTGPTGSGKTTTLYAALSKLNRPGVKIITIEDPIEYELEGIMQIQIRAEIGLTFAGALRSILRHDPDIMMVGEVRDLETAELAIRTSLTGHLMFSTLHTNDSPSGITRLIDIGIEPYLVASSVNAFISQRLVRTICHKCKTEEKNPPLLPDALKGHKIFKGIGCKDCASTGYLGRCAIYEILVIDDSIRELIMNRAPSTAIRSRAEAQGFRSLFDAGLEKIKQGVTTLEEVMRVVEA